MPKRDTEAANLPTRAKPDLTELAMLIMRATRMGIKVALPGRVVSYNATTQLANVSTEILVVLPDPVLGIDVPQLPLVLVDVPVVFPSNGAGSYLIFPIAVGVTTGQLLVNDRSIGRWLNVGTPTDPSVATSHKLEDAVFLPGLHPKTNPIPVPPATTAVLEAPLVNIGAGAAQAAMLGTAFLALYNSHVHPDPLSGSTGITPSQMVVGTHTSVTVKVK